MLEKVDVTFSASRKYNDFPEFFKDYTNLICTNKRYEKARGQIGKQFYQALSDGGYATDPNYVKMATQIYNQLGCT